eukprot:11206359-Lingulodinium_polyedra.AAC.1
MACMSMLRVCVYVCVAGGRCRRLAVSAVPSALFWRLPAFAGFAVHFGFVAGFAKFCSCSPVLLLGFAGRLPVLA